MLRKIVAGLFLIIFLTGFCNCIEAQNTLPASDEIARITDEIKVAFDLNKLNGCRLKLRAIEFEKLKTKEEKEQYANAYKQLAVSFRLHRYIRPGFDIYQKYIALRDLILTEEKNKLFFQTKQKQDALYAAIVNEISAAQKERHSLLSDKSSLDSLKKNNFTYCVFFTILLLGIFLFTFSRVNKKLREATSSLQNNRQRILAMSDAVTKGQMSIGIFNRLRNINSVIYAESGDTVSLCAVVEREIKNIKEAEQSLRALKECTSKIKQLSEISSKSIDNVFQKIPALGFIK